MNAEVLAMLAKLTAACEAAYTYRERMDPALIVEARKVVDQYGGNDES